ncbi:hypothetical protein BN946_scf184969.g69 [Trametes cinnabarina]|uniref:Uncharacterized protein n=1 Tax=Pycnoporus cinnabarinus TaxID=5643 RepID=A0A060SYU1_PYCCI|nr:hypothetical protein BN946_scf184969.g69 [Trametes cinnabarina]
MAQASAAATDTSPLQCARCQSGTAPSLPPEQVWDGVFDPKHRTIAAGEIWGIRESLIVPIFMLMGVDPTAFLSRPSTTSSTTSSARSWSFTPSAEEIDVAYKKRHAIRPCVLMSDHAPTDEECDICLLATFRGTKRREELLEIFQYVCFPIYPHVLSANGVHLHFTPEWENDCTWLMAYRFSSKRPLKKPIRSRDVGNGEATIKADADVLAQIDTLSRECYQLWQSKCADDPETLPRCLQGFRRFHERANAGRR